MTMNWTGKRQDGTVYSAVLNDQSIDWTFGDKVATTDAPPKGAMVNLKAAGLSPMTHVALRTSDGRVMVAPKDMVETICKDLAPAPKLMSLEEQRQSIVDRIIAAREAAHDARVAAWEREDERGGVIRNGSDIDAEAAEAELAAFDAAHPEIKAAFDAARNARTDRHIWD